MAVRAHNSRLAIGWWRFAGASSPSEDYWHVKTNLWMGGSPHGNSMYIMGGVHVYGFLWSDAKVIDSHQYFHNWAGGFSQLTTVNNGSMDITAPYVSSDGYWVFVVQHNSSNYTALNVDLLQLNTYAWRDIQVTANKGHSSATGGY